VWALAKEFCVINRCEGRRGHDVIEDFDLVYLALEHHCKVEGMSSNPQVAEGGLLTPSFG